MRYNFFALNIPVLNFSEDPDSSGSIIPPEAHAIIANKVQIVYDFREEENIVGTATVWRTSNKLLANMSLYSSMTNLDACLKMLRRLSPACEIEIREAHKNIILEFKIDRIFLTYAQNHDTTIEPLGEQVKKIPLKEDMN